MSRNTSHKTTMLSSARTMRQIAQRLLPVTLLIAVVIWRVGMGDWILDLSMLLTMALTCAQAKHHLQDVDAIIRYIAALKNNNAVDIPRVTATNGIDVIIYNINKLSLNWYNIQASVQYMAMETGLLFNIIPEPVLTIDKALQITRANNVAICTFGSSIIKKRITSIIKDDDFANCIRRSIANNYDTKIEITSEKGRIYSTTIRNFPNYRQNGSIVALVLFHDITDQRNKEKVDVDFIANASHEIRTPLTTIFGFIETLKSEDVDYKTRREFLDIISNQCTRITNLMADISHLYVLDSNPKPRSYRVINIKNVIDGALKDFTLQLQAANITAKSSYENEMLLTVGDADSLYSVFANLISNSVKYGYRGSELKILCKSITGIGINSGIGGKINNKPFICIKFIDKSNGIAIEDIPRLTERFYRADASRSSKIPGTGLGLSIVLSILKQHNGHLEIKSVLGKGSEFIVFLPSPRTTDGRHH